MGGGKGGGTSRLELFVGRIDHRQQLDSFPRNARLHLELAILSSDTVSEIHVLQARESETPLRGSEPRHLTLRSPLEPLASIRQKPTLIPRRLQAESGELGSRANLQVHQSA